MRRGNLYFVQAKAMIRGIKKPQNWGGEYFLASTDIEAKAKALNYIHENWWSEESIIDVEFEVEKQYPHGSIYY